MNEGNEDNGTAPGSGSERRAHDPARSGGGRTETKATALDSASLSSIEGRLRNMFDEVASEPVPERFLELLDRLERSEGTPPDDRRETS